MTNLVTRCPKCSTAFRLTSNQLESARGSVRCGSCLHIFKAQDHLAAGSPGAPTSAPKPTSTTPTKNPTANIPTAKSASNSKPAVSPTLSKKIEKEPTRPAPLNKEKALEDEEDLLISDDMDKSIDKDSAYDFDGFMEVNLQPKQSASLFDREIRYEPQEEKEHIDESWAENLLENDIKAEKLARTQEVPIPDIKQIKGKKQSDSSANKKKPANDGHSNATNHKPPVFSFVDDHNTSNEGSEFNEEFSGNFNNTNEPNVNQNSHTEIHANDFASGLFDEEEDFNKSQTSSKKIKNYRKPQQENTSRAALLMNIIPAPIELTAKRMRNWYQERLWFCLALLASITLIFQIAYFKFDYFSRIEPYRSAYAILCPVFRCEVPSLVDISQISAYNLVVRPHPEAENAIIVDAIILNKAPFDQPFPNILLAFSTLDNIPVTSRRFTPKEYLGGELAGMNLIPHSQPVHITLELVSPGPDAVNYDMSATP